MGHRCIETIVESFSTWIFAEESDPVFPRTKKKGATFDGTVSKEAPDREISRAV